MSAKVLISWYREAPDPSRSPHLPRSKGAFPPGFAASVTEPSRGPQSQLQELVRYSDLVNGRL